MSSPWENWSLCHSFLHPFHPSLLTLSVFLSCLLAVVKNKKKNVGCVGDVFLYRSFPIFVVPDSCQSYTLLCRALRMIAHLEEGCVVVFCMQRPELFRFVLFFSLQMVKEICTNFSISTIVFLFTNLSSCITKLVIVWLL